MRRNLGTRMSDPTEPVDTDSALFALKDERAILHVYQPVALAEPPEWSPFLPIPGMYQHPVYGELDLGTATYERMVGNFKSGVYGQELPVNVEHDPHAAGAVGWIEDMRLADSGAIEAKVRWSKRGRDLIEDDRFRYVSAEFLNAWTDPVEPDKTYQDVAVGLALTTHPYFKERVLPPLVASEAVLTLAEAGKEQTMPDDPKITPAPEPAVETPPIQEKDDDVTKIDPPVEKVNEPTETVAQLTERMLGEFAAKVGPDAQLNNPLVMEFGQVMATKVAEFTQRAKQAEVEAARLMTENATLREASRLKTFSDEAMGQSKDNGTAWIGDIADHVRLSIALAEKFGEDSWELRHWVQTNRSHSAQINAGFLFKEIGSGRTSEGMSGHEKAEVLARQLREQNPALSKEQAYSQVIQAHPELYQD